MALNTPINKGNYGMETKEREVEFERKRALGWEEEYKKYRDNWVLYAKEKIVSEYPLLVDIELSSLCNLHCPMCYTITEEFKNRVKTQLMDYSLFKKMIDEIGGKVPAIRLSLRGEATLHPKFIDCIMYAKKNGIKEVSFLTNGANLDEEFFIKIANAGADWITISVDGLYETYETIRKPLKFADIYKKIKEIHAIKNNNGWEKPVIKVQGIWPAIKDNPEDYYHIFEPITDYIAFNPLIDYLSNDIDIIYEDNFSCPQPFQRLVVGSDGIVMLCSNDEECRHPLGDINVQSIYDVWHNEKIEKIRELHIKGDFFKNEVCRACYIPRKTECNEKAVIDDRQIVIKNYINRTQEIGK